MLTFARRRTPALMEGLLIASIVALLAGLVGLVGSAQGRPPGDYAAGEILVQFRDHVDSIGRSRIVAGVGGATVASIDVLGVKVVRVPRGQEDVATGRLRANPAVAFAERNGIWEATASPNDPYLLSQLNTSLNQVKAAQGWDVTTGSAGFIVAVVDTGVAAHADLTGKLVAGYDFVNGDADPNDDHGHGTHVAGIIGAATNNALGVAGLCWGCKIMPLKVLGADGTGSNSNIAAAITHAADNGARVINLSLGGTTASTTVKAAVDYATARGAAVVAAVGNQGCACVLYPAAFSNVIAVGAVDPSNVLRTYSNTGPEVDLVAPGTNWTTSKVMSSGYAAFSGTSSATPVVSALVALLWSQAPGLTLSQLEARMDSTATALGETSSYGAGIVNFAAALGASPGPAPTPTPSAPTPTPAPTLAPAPAPTPTAAPTSSPTATAAPTAAPTAPTASTTSKTYKGTLNSRQTTKEYTLFVGAGAFTASLTSGAGLSLTLVRSDGSVVTSAQGATAQLTATLPAGTYRLRVTGTGSKASYSLSVTYVTSP